MSWLDAAIGWVSPAAAVRRQRARAQLEGRRAYAGADRGRLTDGWFTTGSTGADAEIGVAAPLLRERSRDLTRNNPHQAKAVSGWVDNLVGDGIMPRVDTGSDTRNKQIQDLFEEWSDNCDADQIDDFYGIQNLIAREVVEAGEILIRRRWRRASDGYRVPMQLQLIEADLLDSARTNRDARGNNRIIQGIEFDLIGRRSAYWLFPEHPGNGFGASVTSVAVPASEILHIFERQRTQVRGVPWSSPIMRSLRDLADYELSEIVRKKIEASVVGVVTGFENEDDARIGGPSDMRVTSDPAGNQLVESIKPGAILYAHGGKQITFNSPATVGGYSDYKSSMLHTIAAGYRIPFEMLSGDLSQVNYSSIRAGLVEFRRLVKSLQAALFVRRFCKPAWAWFVEAAETANLMRAGEQMTVSWALPKFEWVDPASDIEADINAIRAGIRTLPEVLGERGRTIEEVVAEIERTMALLDAAGIKLDSDPRFMTQVGKIQGADAAVPGGGAPRFTPMAG